QSPVRRPPAAPGRCPRPPELAASRRSLINNVGPPRFTSSRASRLTTLRRPTRRRPSREWILQHVQLPAQAVSAARPSTPRRDLEVWPVAPFAGSYHRARRRGDDGLEDDRAPLPVDRLLLRPPSPPIPP